MANPFSVLISFDECLEDLFRFIKSYLIKKLSNKKKSFCVIFNAMNDHVE